MQQFLHVFFVNSTLDFTSKIQWGPHYLLQMQTHGYPTLWLLHSVKQKSTVHSTKIIFYYTYYYNYNTSKQININYTS